MSAFLYDCLIAGRAALILLGVCLISLALLDLASWLLARLFAALSPSFDRMIRIRSGLAAMDVGRE